MTEGEKFHQPASRILAACFGAYIGVFGLPGCTGQDQAHFSGHLPAAEQKLKTSRLKQVAGDLFARSAARAEASYKMAGFLA